MTSPQPAQAQSEAGTQASGPPSLGWTLVLRRQPARIVDGEPQGGYGDAFELICCNCGDDPDLDYHHVPPGLQQIRGPYSITAGVAAYEKHVRHHWRRAPRPGESRAAGDGVSALSWPAGEPAAKKEGSGGRRQAGGQDS